ncbi:MAG: carboxypeptidase regulatory-like domain-containing protein, partial [Anaerolineae bacterium]|nr:carboxypeptidase regulatory-like domain-containing protein [Anaerolineae bacterium]
PLANATIQVTPYGSTGYPVQTSTGGNGSYQAALRPACYQVKASAFGYASRIVSAVDIITGAVHRLDFTLNPLPTGIVQGTASVTPTTYPPTLPVMISVLNTPVTQTLTPAGTYALELPRGRHVLEVRGNGYYVITATVDVVPGELMELDWMLERAPRLVLVDQGTLYYASVVQYWREGLDRLGHAYDVVPIYDTPLSAGFTTRLLDYDVVLWSAPLGSPGLIGAGPVLESYLAAGGRLLLSGQDVALFDSGGTFYVPPQSYLVEDLAVKYLSDDAPTRDLTGLGPFRPLSVTISGHNGADNQEHPDTITVGDADKATIVWEYAGGAGGGLGAHICTPYRALLFAYGWEAIATSDMRSEVLDRAIDWLVASPPVSGITLEHERAPMIAEPGATITHVVRIRHTGAAGPLDTVTISVMGHRWPTHLSETQFDIPPCTDRYLYVQIDVPADAGVNESDSVRLHIASTLLSQPLTTTLETKTPAALLLVDDDRWYPVEAAYLSTLNRLGVAYDVWDTRHNGEPLTGTTSVSTEMMHRYPLVVWFTGYDWLDPVTEAEEATLLHYLDEGGRLLLSSQDFLYYGETRPLAERLGVLVNNLYLTTTMVSGVRAHAAGGTWGPLALDYPFPNWSDSPEPLPAAEIITRGQFRQPAALAGSGSTPNRWRSIFYAFPLEAVPDETRDRLVDHALGWLSPLGNSSWAISPENPEPGAIVTATLVIRNDGDSTHPFTVAHFIPASLILSEASLPPDVTYVPESRYLQWNDSISAGEVLTRSWRAQLVEDAARGKRVAADVQIELPEWDLGFEYETVIWVTGPNLAQSQWLAPAGGQIEVGEPASLTLALINGEQGGAFSGVVDLWLMPGLALPGATEAPTQGTSSRLWEGNIAPGKTHYLTVVVQAWRSTTPLRIDAVFTSDSGQTWERSLWLAVAPKRLYLPLVMRN